jgi:chromosome segregation ATPase
MNTATVTQASHDNESAELRKTWQAHCAAARERDEQPMTFTAFRQALAYREQIGALESETANLREETARIQREAEELRKETVNFQAMSATLRTQISGVETSRPQQDGAALAAMQAETARRVRAETRTLRAETQDFRAESGRASKLLRLLHGGAVQRGFLPPLPATATNDPAFSKYLAVLLAKKEAAPNPDLV